MSEHVAGKPVSYTTYTNHACRCDGCRAEATKKQREFRSKPGTRTALRPKAEKIAVNEAAKWMRRHEPDVWRRITAEAEAKVGLNELPKYARQS